MANSFFEKAYRYICTQLDMELIIIGFARKPINIDKDYKIIIDGHVVIAKAKTVVLADTYILYIPEIEILGYDHRLGSETTPVKGMDFSEHPICYN